MKLVISITIWFLAVLALNSQQNFYFQVVGRNGLKVYCKQEDPRQSPLNITNVERLYIDGCKPMPFYRLIPSNITEIDLEDLELNAMSADPPLTEAHFANLTVRTLNITGKQRLEPSPNFLNPLTTLTKMAVSNMVLPPLPVTSRLVQISLTNGRSGAIGGCSELQDLNIIQWTVEEIPGGWLASCKHVAQISMERVGVKTIYRVVRGAKSLKMLWINESALVTLSADLLAGATQLRTLHILGSGLHSINEFAFKDQRTALKYLDLSSNELRGETAAPAILGLSGLQVLYLVNNPLSDFCEHFDTLDRLVRPWRLGLHGESIPRLCFSSWSSLQTLDLEMNNITEMTLTALPIPLKRMMVSVNLANNPLHAPPDSLALYNALKQRFNMLDSKSSVAVNADLALNCDCQHGWFAKALRELRNLRITGINCDRTKFDYSRMQPSMLLECDKSECKPCTCRRFWSDNGTVADCRNRSLHRVPRIHGVNAMLASDNGIAAIYAEDFPASLRMVDLSYNKLRRADAAAAHVLLAEGSARQVRLFGNPLVCDCENGPLINELQNNNLTVEDYSQLKCASSGTPLARVSVFELCGSAWEWGLVIVASLSVMAALVATVTAFYFRHNRIVRVFLHARGLLCCGIDDEADADFLYDAFVSFSHHDAEFAEQLLTGLESESNGWRTCVHYRDWVPGELIPTQISLSVERSRRTIVLLSRNFLASMWGMLEFRTAHATALHDGRLRLVLVVLDDVLDERLSAEVRSYVRINTYVRWDDPWFWDKLLYVMPPRRAAAS